MRCDKCNFYGEIDEKDILLDYIKNNCTHCKGIKEEINLYSKLAETMYEKDIENWLYSNTPVIFDGNIIIGDLKNYEFPRALGETKIRDICLKYNMNNLVARAKDEKKTVIYKLLGTLYDDLFRIIDINPEAILIGILTCLEFNRYISAILVSGLMKSFINNEPQDSKLGRMINQTFQMLLSSKNMAEMNGIKMDLNFDSIYCELESQFAFDKLCFEYGIEAVHYRIEKNNRTDDENNFNEYNYFEMLSLLRAIVTLRSAYIEFIDGYYRDHDLIILDGYFTDGNLFSGYENNYIENMTAQQINKSFIRHKEEFNKVLSAYKGFTIDTIQRISEAVQHNYIIGNEILIGNHETWIKLFMKFGLCNLNEAVAVFNEFIFKPANNMIYSVKSRKEDRITRKPIVKYDNIYYSIVDLLLYSMNLFIIGIFTGDFKDKEFNSKFQELYENINIDFEYEIYNLLKHELFIEKLKYNVGQKDIRINKIIVEIPGQIDIIAIYAKKLFVIECKNFDLKIDPKSVANEYGRLTKETRESVQIKLEDKINIIKANKEIVAKFLGEENPDTIDKEPIGVIVTNVFTIATMAKDVKYNIITKDKLIEWIKNSIDKCS